MSGFSVIDLSRLPVPAVVETLDFEVILAEMTASLAILAPEIAPALALESEPVVKLLEVCAYREVLLRARINDAAKAVLLPTATGADLDNLGALFGVERLIITTADPEADPPVAEQREGDTDFRTRIQLALEGYSVAGPRGAYIYHAMRDARVKDVAVASPNPGEVQVTLLTRIGTGLATAEVTSAVSDILTAEDVRPLCDTVTVQSATILTYAVTAQLVLLDGVDQALVLATAQAEVATYVADSHRLGRAMRLSGLYAALHQPGVAQVILASPAADIVPAATGAAYCTGIAVTVAA
jgi:phage-related baseplate assembly protein